jgi:diguanylate cyclase (GGDEF)-like protein
MFKSIIREDVMFLDALQSYYAPAVALVFFSAMVITDKLFSKRIKRLFLWEIGLIFLVIVDTWADYCFGGLPTLEGSRLRTLTTFINFAISPCLPMILVFIYETEDSKRFSWWFYLPLIMNAVMSLLSIWFGLIFNVSVENVYTRGPLFVLPFLASGFYLLSLIFYSARQRGKPNRKSETGFLLLFLFVIGLAIVIEILFHVHFIVWSVAEVFVILYYLFLTTQKILYDPLTGTYNRIAYEKQLEKINWHSECTIAMIDLDNLKHINDQFGHSSGDAAICSVASSILNTKCKHMWLYRYGGDEFVLLSNRLNADEMKKILKASQARCEEIKGIRPCFSYGVAEYRMGDDLHNTILNADIDMYRHKKNLRDV